MRPKWQRQPQDCGSGCHNNLNFLYSRLCVRFLRHLLGVLVTHTGTLLSVISFLPMACLLPSQIPQRIQYKSCPLNSGHFNSQNPSHSSFEQNWGNIWSLVIIFRLQNRSDSWGRRTQLPRCSPIHGLAPPGLGGPGSLLERQQRSPRLDPLTGGEAGIPRFPAHFSSVALLFKRFCVQ